MTEEPGSYQVKVAIAERDRLLRECQRLLFRVSRGPNCLKLLAGVKIQLQIFSKYKANRAQERNKRLHLKRSHYD